MNWIFTIVFSGLLFSTDQGTALDRSAYTEHDAVTNSRVRADETERFEQTYPLTPGGRVSVSNVNGEIVVEAWDRNEVQLVAVKTADSKERLQDVEIRVNAKPDSISIETSYDRWRQNNDGWKNGSKLRVDYHLMVPRGAVLNEIETVNGDVRVSEFNNQVKISAVNGKVIASKLKGTANLSTVNGEVAADFGSLDATSKITLSTVNGRVNLTIPSDASATVKADSLNGNIENDFGLPVRKGKYVGRDLYGKLGGGDAKIKLDSVNGSLKLTRVNDGKTPGPVTDLLPAKSKDDDWDNNDEEGKVKIKDKAQKDVARAVRDSQRKSVEAAAEARRAIDRARPEIERAVETSTRATAEAVKRSVEVVNSAQIQQAVTDALMQQKDNIAKIADAMYFPSIPQAERQMNSFPVKGVPTVTVETNKCPVKITGWDRSEVKYVLSRSASSRDQSRPQVKESHNDSNVTLGVDGTTDSGRIRLEVFVPRKSNLKIKSDSEIRLDGVSGEMDLQGAEESVNVRDADGKLTVATTSGRVRVIGFKGELHTETADGLTSIEGDLDALTAKAETGTVIVTIPSESSASIVSASPHTNIDGLNLATVKEKADSREYRLGAGRAKLKITTGGEVLLRSPEAITSQF